MNSLNLTQEELRSLVIQYLNEPTTDHRQLGDLKSGVARIVVNQYGVQPTRDGASGIVKLTGQGQHLNDGDYARVVGVIWDLIIEGVVRPGYDTGKNTDLPFFYVTEYGKAKIKDPTTPYDPDGYLKRISTDVPEVDEVIITYLTESLHAFRIGCLLSSTITLGCASEKALLLLIAAYGDALPSPRDTQFRKNTEGKVIKRQLDEFQKMLDSHLMGLLPGDLKENLDHHLSGIFSVFRTNRNQAGHPTGQKMEREQVYSHLVIFPSYLKTVYNLMGWLKENAPLK